MNSTHDIHDFVLSAQREIQNEYERIQKRAKEDPGTAGDQGEENWATLLRNWLPSYFHVVTKGRILCENNYASPQIDVLVLHPSYPKILLDKKLYLSGGVAAAFECKTTLIAADVSKAVKTAADIRRNMRSIKGTPYKELNSSLVYGLLAHSHSWQKPNSKPADNVSKTLVEADGKYADHPIQSLDFITVADLGSWRSIKHTYFYEYKAAMSVYVEATADHPEQTDHFFPISVLLLGIFSKLSWTYSDMRHMEFYFRNVMSSSGGGEMRFWPPTIYSNETNNGILKGLLVQNKNFDEWSRMF